MIHVSLAPFLFWLSWIGNISAVVASYKMSDGNLKGWWFYLAADLLIIGFQIYHHLWNNTALFVAFTYLSLRGLYKNGFLPFLTHPIFRKVFA